MTPLQYILIGAGVGGAAGLTYALLRDSGPPPPPNGNKFPPNGNGPPPPPPPQKDCPPAGTRVLLIGDSYSVGFGPRLSPHAGRCATPYHHKGVVGSSVTQWRKNEWLQPEIGTVEPTVALISLGGNDFQRNDPQNVDQAIGELLAKLRAAGARPLWISPPTTPFPDKIGVRDMWKRRMGSDWFDSTKLDIPRVASDPLGHPTGGGYKLWADAIWPWMSTKLSASTSFSSPSWLAS